MHLTEFLDFDAIKPAVPAGNKRSLLNQLASLAATRLDVAPAAILETIAEREKLGSTGFGDGVAIPHGKVDGLNRIYCLFVRLAEPVRYKAIDGEPVDLVFLLLSPPDAGADHLKALAAISRVIRHAPTLEKMRGARSRDALAAVLLAADERDAA
ncbi:PTS sugar transporter subunit IIA [Sphingomonas sabuli]|uniref:PTS sugar transporter subunit IIA n=1 Tax=Sphingomonas sabuli TaxID=2764186 RepID=A0A7G9L0F6_9SPHN|nr:PTS sugar transporter subunit IIA [Sphingomonas sabuli]QNM82105.1 PTS sugar transporter subunit IIA [Sphingomonas sabuli]